jgi:hypothetical protein
MRRRERQINDRDTSGAIDFDAALEAYIESGDAEELLRAAALVVGSSIALDEDRAETVAVLTGCPSVLADYDDGRPRRPPLARPDGGGAPACCFLPS